MSEVRVTTMDSTAPESATAADYLPATDYWTSFPVSMDAVADMLSRATSDGRISQAEIDSAKLLLERAQSDCGLTEAIVGPAGSQRNLEDWAGVYYTLLMRAANP
jgi:hypothetical protein